MVGQRAHLHGVAVVADADDGDLGGLDELHQLLQSPPVLVARHPVHLVHDHAVVVARHWAAVRAWGQKYHIQ